MKTNRLHNLRKNKLINPNHSEPKIIKKHKVKKTKQTEEEFLKMIEQELGEIVDRNERDV